jgi:hypothetical protein
LGIVQPFVTLFPESVAAIDGARFVDVSSDDQAYWRLLTDLWRKGEDFCIVEQDNVPAPGVLQEIESCPEEWCGEPYLLGGQWGCRFGVVRFRGALMARYPFIPDAIKARSWHALDSAWINHLRLVGPQEPHWHWPAAKHLRSDWSPLFSCNTCGTALTEDDLRRDPRVQCRSCGAVTTMPVGLTMTDSVL